MEKLQDYDPAFFRVFFLQVQEHLGYTSELRLVRYPIVYARVVRCPEPHQDEEEPEPTHPLAPLPPSPPPLPPRNSLDQPRAYQACPRCSNLQALGPFCIPALFADPIAWFGTLHSKVQDLMHAPCFRRNGLTYLSVCPRRGTDSGNFYRLELMNSSAAEAQWSYFSFSNLGQRHVLMVDHVYHSIRFGHTHLDQSSTPPSPDFLEIALEHLCCMLSSPLLLLWPPYRVRLELQLKAYARHPALRALACATRIVNLPLPKTTKENSPNDARLKPSVCL